MKRLLKFITNSMIVMSLVTIFVVLILFYHMTYNLPDINTLKTLQFQVPMHIYSRDHQLIAQYGEKRRTPITLQDVPKPLIQAILATEDQRFFDHPGVDIWGLLRAAKIVFTSGSRSQGGSTITMQVARNFFLSRQKTYHRKISEILLAIKIDNSLSKKKILELYLNQIYFGNRAYGVAAAAQAYYGKTLAQLTLPEIATLAGLPQAPSSINPLANKTKALKRRNHVLSRMLEQKYISKEQYLKAIKAPETATYHDFSTDLSAPYVAELAREMVIAHYGKEGYEQGLQVYTTVDAKLQRQANQVLQQSVIKYDRQHGYRKPEQHWSKKKGPLSDEQQKEWQEKLADISVVHGLIPAVVIAQAPATLTVLNPDGEIITLKDSRARYPLGRHAEDDEDTVYYYYEFRVGDVIRIQAHEQGWRVAQLPQVEGAIVAMDPNNGMVLAMAGGFNYQASKFNRVVQAKRQPGSTLKPFIYSAALEDDITLATLINDAPIVLGEEDSGSFWRPQNHSKRFYGLTRVREGLVMSRNLISVRLLKKIGIERALTHLEKFGFDPATQPHSLSLALGAGEVTPLNLTTGFAAFANNGYRVTPYIIEKITDSEGKVIFQAKPKSACTSCSGHFISPLLANAARNHELPQAPKAITAQNAYLMNNVLQDVIKRGTAKDALSLHRQDIAGKTGTTNNQMDAWFSGYTPDLVVTTWMGFDQPKSLYEYASATALPMWIDFMSQALQGVPEKSITQPEGIMAVRINKATGRMAQAHDPNSIFELFRSDNAPLPAAAPGEPIDQPANAIAGSDDDDPAAAYPVATPDSEQSQPAKPEDTMDDAEEVLQELF